jgi:hypothetical protein
MGSNMNASSSARQRMGIKHHDADQAEAENKKEKIQHSFAPFSGFAAKIAQTTIRLR